MTTELFVPVSASQEETSMRSRSPAIAVLLVFLTCTFAVLPLIAFEVHRHHMLTPIDESTYIDYLYKIGDGHFVIGSGEPVGGEAQQEVYCRGISRGLRDPDPVRCAESSPPPAGRNSADIDPPTYYVITYGAARAIMWMGLTDNLVTAGRLTGVLWAGSGLACLVLLSRALGASRLASAAAAGVVAVIPGVLGTWHYVTPHATNLTVGALVALLVVRWERRQVGMWALVVAGALPPLVKAPQIMIALVMAAYLLIGSKWLDEREHGFDRRRLIGGLTVLAALIAASLAWLGVRAHYALTDVPAFPQFNVDSFEWRFVLENIGIFVRPWTAGYSAGAGLTILVVLWCYGQAVGATGNPGFSPTMRKLAVALLPVAAFGALVFVLSTFVLLGQYVRIPERYGFTLIPLVLAFGAVALRTRASLVGAAIVGGGLLMAVLTYPMV